MRPVSVVCLLVAFRLSDPSHAQTNLSWTQLSLSTCNVDAFLSDRPQSDGRGVIIAVLDTGVDPSIPGLGRTPEGDVKVIDVQDFTGQGDVELHRVPLNDRGDALVDYDDDGAPIEYALPDFPADGSAEQRLYWLGKLDEARFVNSDLPDLNDNGQTTDAFAVLVTALSGDGDDQAAVYVDTDLDRGFADEKPLRSYRLNFDTFTLSRAKPERQIVPATFAVNVFLRKSKVVIVYDDGAHGTHVAGIAAGYRINNQDGFNGVAPGAKLMGLKIGQNALGGVSTTGSIKNALEYAARYAREHGLPIVCNLSYGVESVIEGDSDIDRDIDEILRKNPHLVFCTSAGNEGPGLSSVGTPAAANEAIAVGAMLAADTARDVMGFDLDAAVMTAFSSVGGEVDKPDFAVPGWATSTVPRWVRRGDYWAGTSMASPYAAGLCALLISDAMARHPGQPVRAWVVRRALRLSGRPVPGATPLSMGHGVPDIARAAELLDQIVSAAKDDPVIGYDISTPCPHGYDGSAPAAYWRSTFFPKTEPQRFTVTPLFAPTTDASARTAFVRKFTLRSTAPWCQVRQESTYLRGEQSADVFVEYDAQALKQPGLHVAAVEASQDGRLAFRLLNSIIVPHETGPEEDYELSFANQRVSGWNPMRYFLAVPPGASAMTLTLTAPAGTESKAGFERIYDPTGRRHRNRSNRLDTTEGRREVAWNVTDDLIPGVWEVPIVADRPDRDWPFDLHVRFFGLHAQPQTISEWDDDGAGEVTVTNVFNKPLSAAAAGKIEGFRKFEQGEFKGLKDELSYTLTLDTRFDRVRLDLEMTPQAYAATTDIGVSLESGGEEIFASAFSNRTLEAIVKIPEVTDETEVKLIIRAGFATADDKRKTPITVRFDQLLADPMAIDVRHGDASNLLFVPAVPITMEFEPAAKPPAAPKGLLPVGYVEFNERHSGQTALRLPLEIED